MSSLPREAEASSAASTGTEASLDLSIVIVVYRTPDYLKRCLDAIESAAPKLDYEVLVVDNAPADTASAEVAKGRSRVRYHESKKNLGFGGGVNLGIKLGLGRHFLVLNPDVAIEPGSAEALVRFLDEESDVGIAAPRLNYPDGSLQYSVRRFYTFPVFLLRRTFLGKVFPKARALREHLMLDWDHASTRDVDWCLGGGMMVRRSAVEDVGLMDERFFLYFEDVDWCYRMQQRGWRVVYLPAARMQHDYQRASAKGFWPKRGLWIHLASLVRFYEKWSFLLYWLKLRSGFFRRAALFLVDLIGVVLAFLVAYSVRSFSSGLFDKPLFAFHKYYRFLFFAVGSAGAFFILTGLYQTRTRASFLENLLAVSRALLWTSLVLMATTFLSSVRVYSRLVVVMFLPLAVLIVTTLRTSLLAIVESFKQHDLNLKRVGLIGPGEEVADLLGRIERFGRFGLEPVPLLSPDARATEDAARLARRARHERCQEVLVYESWRGDLPALVAELRATGLPLRLVPRVHGLIPGDSNLISFYGLPAMSLTGTGRRRSIGLAERMTDLVVALALAGIGLLPFLAVAVTRALKRRPLVEAPAYHGGGASRSIKRLASTSWGAGFWRTLVASYPALPALARSEIGLVGLYPFTEEEWLRLDEEQRLTAPAGRPGLLGPWTRRPLTPEEALEWNRRYASEPSVEEDLRILGRALFRA